MQLTENTYFGENNRYYLEKLLGRGGFSEVWLVKDSITNLELALKVYAPSTGMDNDGLQTFSRELARVYNISHTNLLKPQYVDSWQGMPYLIMPYCSQGSLVKRIGKMNENEIRRVIHDVASGLAYLHEHNIIHQDIKPDNILIDETGNYVITDFGISTRARSTLRKNMTTSFANSGGTIAYMGPERFSKEPAPTKASDIWSLGATIYELMTGDTPFGEHGGLIQKSGAEIPNLRGDYSEDLKQLVIQMLMPNPKDRPTAATISKGHFSTHTAKCNRPTITMPNVPSIQPTSAITTSDGTLKSDKSTKKGWIVYSLLLLAFVSCCIGYFVHTNTFEYKFNQFKNDVSSHNISASIYHNGRKNTQGRIIDLSQDYENLTVLAGFVEKFGINTLGIGVEKLDIQVQGCSKKELKQLFTNSCDIFLTIDSAATELCIDIYAIFEHKSIREKVLLLEKKYAVVNIKPTPSPIIHEVKPNQDSGIMYIGRKEKVIIKDFKSYGKIEITGGAIVYNETFNTRIIVPHDTATQITISVYTLEYGMYFLSNTKSYRVKQEISKAPKGTFSVSDNTYVFFSNGNLQYNCKTKRWRFASNEWDRLGYKNSNSPYAGGEWYDLFPYGATGYNDTNPTYSGVKGFNISETNYDWGKFCFIDNGNGYSWRTLTEKEIRYLFEIRPQAKQLYSIGTVNGVHGLIILPDNWKCPKGLTFTSLAESPTTNSYFDINWDKMKRTGAVFLPASGICTYNGVFGASPYGDWEGGRYWTSTSWEDDLSNAYTLSFSMGWNNVYMGTGESVGTKLAVRLVRNTK